MVQEIDYLIFFLKVIDEVNQERIDVGKVMKNPVYTGDTSIYVAPVQQEEEQEIEVSIIIR